MKLSEQQVSENHNVQTYQLSYVAHTILHLCIATMHAGYSLAIDAQKQITGGAAILT